MNKIVPCICIPSSGQVKAKFAVSLASLMCCVGSTKLREGVEEQRINVYLLEGSNIAENRLKLVQRAMAAGGTHIVFIDDDMSFSNDLLHRLLAHRLPIVACNYPRRRPHKGFVAGKLDGSIMATTAASTGLEEALWTGFGFAVIEVEVFQRISLPWFINAWIAEAQGFTTEDLPFCAKAREAGYRILIDHDASKQLQHCGTYEYAWDDPLIEFRAGDEVDDVSVD